MLISAILFPEHYLDKPGENPCCGGISSSMNILYFVRHGQTTWNDIGRFQGSTDIQLNALGIEQAEKTAQAMKDIPLDAIFSSPLERAQVTAKTIAQPHHLTVQVEPRIAEINFGQWEGLTFEEIETRWPGRLHEMYVHPDTVDIPGSETFGEAEARTMDFLNELIRTNKNKTFLIVSHGAAIRTMICGLLQLPLDRAWNLSQGNANITRIEALEEGRNILRTLNSTAHLRNEL